MKSTILIRRRPALHAAAMKQTVLFSLFFLFAAHAFCFFNLTYSSGSVMLNVSDGRSAQIAGGQFLLPIYWRIRGSLSAPLFIGMLSALYLTLTNLVLVCLLQLTQPAFVFALCGATTVNAAVLSICAASLHTADAAFLAMLLCALACASCMYLRLGALPGALMLTCALALDAGSCAFFAALALIAGLSNLLLDGSAKSFLTDLARFLLAAIAGIALYLIGFSLMLRRSSLSAGAAPLLFGGDLLGAYLAPMRALLAPLTAYPSLSVMIRALYIPLCVYAVVRFRREKGAASAALLAAGMLLLPLFAAFTLLSGQESIQITPAHCLLDILAILLLSRILPDSIRLRRAAAAVLGILFLGGIVFSNQVYLKKNLEFESTLSVMTRVIARIESVEGYQPGHTPIAVIGTPEASALSAQRRGFEHLSALDAASANYAIASDTDMTWYIWEVMGYPLNFVSTYDLARLRQTEEAQAMPLFPQEGCCRFIGDTLVIKISD